MDKWKEIICKKRAFIKKKLNFNLLPELVSCIVPNCFFLG